MSFRSADKKMMSFEPPVEDAELLAEAAREADRSMSAEIRRAIRAHLDRSKRTTEGAA